MKSRPHPRAETQGFSSLRVPSNLTKRGHPCTWLYYAIGGISVLVNDAMTLASPVGVMSLALSNWCGESGPTVGVVDLASPVGVVGLTPPVGVVNLAPLVGVVLAPLVGVVLAPLVGVVDLASPAGMVDLASPVGVVLAPPGGVI